MKLILVAFLLGALAVQDSEAFFRGGLRGGMFGRGMWGGGMWGGGMWGGGLWNPWWGPRIIPVPVMGAPFIGKRSAETPLETEFTFNHTHHNHSNPNATYCRITKDFNFTCHGLHKFDCEVTPRFEGLNELTLRTHGLTFVPEEIKEGSVKKFQIVTRVPESNKFGLLKGQDQKDLKLWIFASEEVKEVGYFVKDAECWDNFQTMINESTPKNIRLALAIFHEKI